MKLNIKVMYNPPPPQHLTTEINNILVLAKSQYIAQIYLFK